MFGAEKLPDDGLVTNIAFRPARSGSGAARLSPFQVLIWSRWSVSLAYRVVFGSDG